MKVTISIKKEYDKLFRSCVCAYDSIAISNAVCSGKKSGYIDFTLEPTICDFDLIADLFNLGKVFGWSIGFINKEYIDKE